ncbi:glycoside hydrolase family 113 [Alkalihalobacterium bogoriense]|uniref:glycoside hydrolase family 113 n=1 Tax=Alkalihalobacterium bogoriense TaxID=246272 RepID=UPI00047B50B9|nr:1,4-beta-xylanase [Alkalihalobacterium bogoriense]
MEYIKGMTWGWVGTRGEWKTEEAQQSMIAMSEMAVNWTAIAFQGLQETAFSTEIDFKNDPVVTDDEVYWAIKQAKQLDLNVCLKPVVNCKDGTWRAHINFFDLDVPCEPKWSEWFASYEAFILHYAKIAEETSCEMFCIGCEMVQTDRREVEWRGLIKKVRSVYSGLITYNCDKYQETEVKWWDAVDIISSSGYYPIGAWDKQCARIKPVIEKYNKPFFFMEAGCPSRNGSPEIPNDWNLNKGQVNEEAQQQYFEEMFRETSKHQWINGFMLWDWPAILYSKDEAAQNDDYCMYGKKAEKTVKAFYASK